MSVEAIVIVDHGSKNMEVNTFLLNLTATLQISWPHMTVCHAHMEVSPPFLDEVLDSLMNTGIQRVYVYPFFLIPGKHIQTDIPLLIEQMRAKYPRMSIVLFKSLGQSEHIPEWVSSHLTHQIEGLFSNS